MNMWPTPEAAPSRRGLGGHETVSQVPSGLELPLLGSNQDSPDPEWRAYL
jgi:hypothetical protein